MPRRILVLNERDPNSPLAGGAETHLFEIFGRLAQRGQEITVLASRFPGCAPEETVQGVRVVRLANRYSYYLLVPFALRRELRARRYDLVVDVLNKLPFLSPWFAGVPCFAIVHHLFGTTAFRQVPLPIAVVTWLAERLIPLAYRRTPMLAISPSTKEDLVARGVPADHVWVVPPGIDHATYRPLAGGAAGAGASARESAPARRSEAGGEHADTPGDKPTILWIGRVEPYKRADVIIDAMPRIVERVPDAELVIVGEGSVREELAERACAVGLCERVRFTGFVSEEEKIRLLQRAAVVVNTSEKEGWGMTVIEANACGVPCVSSDVPGLRDSVRHGETGLLVPFGDAGALAAAVLAVLLDRDLRARLVANGLRWAARFSWDPVASDVQQLVEEAIAPSGARPQLVASPFSAA